MKKIVSIGGWAYSTEAATYNIIRQAIITNKNAFTTNLAQFVKDEGIDGIDIDWEYPGVSIILYLSTNAAIVHTQSLINSTR